MNRFLLIAMLLPFAVAIAAPLTGAEESGDYIKVKNDGEFKVARLPIKALDEGKTLEVKIRGTFRVGVVAIGGETTGAVIKVGKTTWELDFAADPKLLAIVKEQNGKSVIVVGKVTKREGVEVKTRTIVKVSGIKAAGK